jgi:hemerythrin-like metal-binding protein
MDDEHARLHASLTELGHLVDAPLPATATEKTRRARGVNIQVRLDRLRLEASAHFAHEERVMHTYGYPMTNDHVAKHTKFLRKLDKMMAGYADGEEVIASHVVRFVQIWFARHTVHSDQRLSDWLKQHHPDVTI